MRRKTRERIARLAYLLEERNLLSAGTCACGRPRQHIMTDDVRKALDEVVAATADEPDHWASYLETK